MERATAFDAEHTYPCVVRMDACPGICSLCGGVGSWF